jgi:hypothetical protein
LREYGGEIVIASAVGSESRLLSRSELPVLAKPLAFRCEFYKMPAKPPVIRASGGPLRRRPLRASIGAWR